MNCKLVKGERSIRARDVDVAWFGLDVLRGRLVLLTSVFGLLSSYDLVLFSHHQICDISWSTARRCGWLPRSRPKHLLPFLNYSGQPLDRFRMPRSVSVSPSTVKICCEIYLVHGEIVPDTILPAVGSAILNLVGVDTKPVINLSQHHAMVWGLQ